MGNFCFAISSFSLVILPALFLFTAGCRSEPAEKQVYIPEDVVSKMKPVGDDEFKLVWTDDSEIKKYDKVKVNVFFNHDQLNTSGWERSNSVYLFYSPEEKQVDIIKYMSQSFDKSFAGSKCFKKVEQADSKTMILNLSIVQIVPNKPVVGAFRNLSTLTPIGAIVIPVKMGMSSYSSSSGGAIAVEGMLTDSKGKILGAFADRAKAPTSLFSFYSFTPYANIENIIDTWSAGIVSGLDSIHQGQKPKFKTEPGFQLIY